MLNTIYKDVPVAQQDEYFEYIAKTVMDGAALLYDCEDR